MKKALKNAGLARAIRSDASARLVLAVFAVLDVGVFVDGSLYFRGLGAELVSPTLAVVTFFHVTLLSRAFRDVLLGRRARPNACVAFCLGFSALPASGLAGGWLLALGGPGGLEELAGDTITALVTLLSCLFGFGLLKWMLSIAAEVRRAKRSRAVDGREIVALRVYRGALSAAVAMLALRLLYTVSVPTRDADFIMVFVWGAASVCLGVALQSLRARRAHRRAWLNDVIDDDVDGYRVEPVGEFPNAGRIPPFHSSVSGTYTGILVRELQGEIEILGRIP